jgi:hypothetical protein
MGKRITQILMMVLPLLAISSHAQNLFIQITDKESYQPVADVRADLHSAQRTYTYYSSANGFINESVPEGIYTLRLSRPGYKDLVRENLQIRPFDVNRLSFDMERGVNEPVIGGTDPTTNGGRIADNDPGTTTQRPPRNWMFELGQQFGNISGTRIGAGYFVFRDIFLQASFNFSRQSYQSLFFKDPVEEYKLTFTKLSTMLGYEYSYPFGSNPKMGLIITPNVSLGMEAVYNNDFIDNSKVFMLMNPALNPALDVGLYYSIAAVFIRLDYAYWLGDAMNQERYTLENGITGRPMQWGEDLFHKRKGLGLQMGIKAYLNRKKGGKP